MPADRLLTTVLRALQNAPDTEETNRILSSTTSLLTTLSNPLNVTLLTSQLLTAPAIWNKPNGLTTCLRVISVFNNAAITVRKYKIEGHESPHDAYQPRLGGGLSCDAWSRAAVKGADEKSPRWMHMLVIGGVLLGMEGQERRGLSSALRTKFEYAMVTAANLALAVPARGSTLGPDSIVLTLAHVFPLLNGGAKAELNYDALVMLMLRAMTSSEGYQNGHFLTAIDFDVRQVADNMFDWSTQSSSFLQLRQLGSKPLISSMGPLSRLIAHAIENMRDALRVLEVREHLLAFSNDLLLRWHQNKLSEIDPSEEGKFLTPDTLRVTFPVLWQILKTSMFATVVILRASVGRTLIDPILSSTPHATEMASKSLITLRNIHFISARLGSNAFSAYTFVNLASIDILTKHPSASATFLKAIYPAEAGQIPAQPLQRNLDLFYLNTAEHFTLALPPSEAEALIATPASPYLNPSANSQLLEIFESAHSAMLAILAAPNNSSLTAKILPFYVDSLFKSFPSNLSPRQFRFAFKALMHITTPPSTLSASQPMMAETLLELLHQRALHALTSPLLPSKAIKSEADADSLLSSPLLSEQAVLLLALLDALPHVTLDVLENWLPMAANLLNVIEERNMREHCKARFWEVLESGEMDVERSAVSVAWWSTRGGRDMVLFGAQEERPLMSGGLGVPGRDESRL